MKEMWARNKESKLNHKSEILLEALALVVIVGLGAAAYAASEKKSDKPPSGQMSFFDPFNLTTIYLDVSQSGSNTTISSGPETRPPMSVTESGLGPVILNGLIRQSQIRIPYRPPIRSPFKPPWVPGPPPWAPGKPPWTPGPPPWTPQGLQQ